MMKDRKKHKIRIGFSLIFSSALVLGTLLTTGIVFFVMWYFSNDNIIRLQNISVVMIFILTLAVATFIMLTLRRVFICPLIKLTDAMNKVAKGDFSIQLDCESKQPDLVEIYNSFNTMVWELSQTDTLQTDFISSVSHEFKTPINAIEGYASLLQDSSLSEREQDTYVEKIIFNTHRLSELVGNMLLLSKISNQSMQPKLSTYRLDEQIRQSILALESKWAKKSIDFDVELDDVEYTGIQNLMIHVWTNLIDNAVKFSSPGTEIIIRLRKTGDCVNFEIKTKARLYPSITLKKSLRNFSNVIPPGNQKVTVWGLLWRNE